FTLCCAGFAVRCLPTLRSYPFKWSACCDYAFLASWRFCLIQSSRSIWIATHGSSRTGFQSARWLSPPLSFGEEFAHETHYSVHSHQRCTAIICVWANRNPSRVSEQQE